MSAGLNANPTVYAVRQGALRDDYTLTQLEDEEDLVGAGEAAAAGKVEPIDSLEVFEHIRHINDPEHPLTLEQLKVTTLENVTVDNDNNLVTVNFTPTIPHCNMATLIGLCIRVKLLRSLPRRLKVEVRVTPGSHASEAAVNKQLGDKERVAAALENAHLLEVVNRCVRSTETLEPATAPDAPKT